jgi:hypothetical protein
MPPVMRYVDLAVYLDGQAVGFIQSIDEMDV